MNLRPLIVQARYILAAESGVPAEFIASGTTHEASALRAQLGWVIKQAHPTVTGARYGAEAGQSGTFLFASLVAVDEQRTRDPELCRRLDAVVARLRRLIASAPPTPPSLAVAAYRNACAA